MKSKIIILCLILFLLNINCRHSTDGVKINPITKTLAAFDSDEINLLNIPKSCYTIDINENNKSKEFENYYCMAQSGYIVKKFYYLTNIEKSDIKYKLLRSDRCYKVMIYSSYIWVSQLIDGREKGIFVEWGQGHVTISNADYIFTNIPKEIFKKYFPKIKGVIINKYPDTFDLEFHNEQNICKITFE